MKEQTSQEKETADYNEAEDAPHPWQKAHVIYEIVRRYSQNFVQVTVAIKNHCVVVPGLSGPEPNPTWPSNERADHNQQNPHQETPTEHVHRKASLSQCVVTVAERIRIDIRKDH